MPQFLADFDRGASKLSASADDVYAAKYAFCAAVDEIILRRSFAIRDGMGAPAAAAGAVRRAAGRRELLPASRDAARAQGAAHLQALEVFHMCLLLGFQGRYILEGPEKLAYLTARLGDEIAH